MSNTGTTDISLEPPPTVEPIEPIKPIVVENKNHIQKVQYIHTRTRELLELIKSSEKLENYKHPERKIFTSYTQDEKNKIQNFRTLAGKLRKLYYFFGDKDIDKLLDEILYNLKIGYYTGNMGPVRDAVRRTWGVTVPGPNNFVSDITTMVIYLPLSLIGKITGKAVDAIRTATTDYKKLVDDLEKYVIEKGIIDKSQLTKPIMDAGTKRRSRKYRHSRKPKRKVGRRSRKH